jgi:orotate phosphoribosyltransferase
VSDQEREGSSRSQLIHLLLEHSVRWGEFTLKSGAKSNFYVDVRKTALHGIGARVIAKAILERLHPKVVALGGVELGAVPLVGSAIVLWQSNTDADCEPLHGFVVRKAAKEHGTQQKIENCPPPGTQVCILEDVTTSGGSLEKAITAAQQAGLDVVQAITVVDRQEGAEEFLRAGGFIGSFDAIVTKTNLSLP